MAEQLLAIPVFLLICFIVLTIILIATKAPFGWWVVDGFLLAISIASGKFILEYLHESYRQQSRDFPNDSEHIRQLKLILGNIDYSSQMQDRAKQLLFRLEFPSFDGIETEIIHWKNTNEGKEYPEYPEFLKFSEPIEYWTQDNQQPLINKLNALWLQMVPGYRNDMQDKYFNVLVNKQQQVNQNTANDIANWVHVYLLVQNNVEQGNRFGLSETTELIRAWLEGYPALDLDFDFIQFHAPRDAPEGLNENQEAAEKVKRRIPRNLEPISENQRKFSNILNNAIERTDLTNWHKVATWLRLYEVIHDDVINNNFEFGGKLSPGQIEQVNQDPTDPGEAY